MKAEVSAVTHPWAAKYLNAFHRDVHQLLAWGYLDARSAIRHPQEEEEVSQTIWEAMEARLDAKDTPERFDFYTPIIERPVSGSTRKGKHSRRLDIVVQSNSIRPRVRFVFEAKRLLIGISPISQYTGRKGLGRFVAAEYAADCSSAGMLGYMQSANSQYWETQLRRKFQASPPELAISKQISALPVLPELPNEWISEHNRANRPCIGVFHILLDCS